MEKTYNITQNNHILNSLFFNHDRNPAHHSALHTDLFLLSLASEKGFHDEISDDVGKKMEIMGDDILKNQGLVVAPGVLLQSLTDNHIPEDEKIIKVETRLAYPVLVPVDKGSKEVKISLEEIEEGDLKKYNVTYVTTDLYGKEINPIKSMKITSFRSDKNPEEMFEKYVKKDMENVSKMKKEPIFSLNHKTYISEDDDECYWRSIQAEDSPKRNGNVSRLELLAKVPRILSMMSDKLQNEPPEKYQGVEREIIPFLRYAEKEKEYGLLNGKTIEKRAEELSKKLRTTYAKQTTIFDPRFNIKIDQHFNISMALAAKKRVMHSFISKAIYDEKVLFVDESRIIGGPLITDNMINYLSKINYSVEELERFRYK